MTREQKSALAFLAMSRVADIIEFWHEIVNDYPELRDVDPREAKEVLASWMRKLPGDAWDTRLGNG